MLRREWENRFRVEGKGIQEGIRAKGGERGRREMSEHREVRSLGVVAASPAGSGNASWTCREISDFQSLLEFS